MGLGSPTGLKAPFVFGVPSAPSAAFWVRSWPRVAVVPFGGSVPINCSRGFCPGPAAPPELLWESESAAGPGGRRWRTFILSNVSQWQPRPALCRAECGDSAANASTAVIVYSEAGGIWGGYGGGGGGVGGGGGGEGWCVGCKF